MEKAKLTKEQAEALEEAKNFLRNDETVIKNHAISGDDGCSWKNHFSDLNGISLKELICALYVGYEIIEEDQVVTVTEEMRKELRMGKKFITLSEPYRMYNEGFENALRIVGIKL